MQGPEPDNQLERRTRKKRDDYSDGDKHQDNAGDGYDRHLSSRDDIAKDGKKKDDRRKEEKHRDKYREEIDRDNKHRHDKQHDERPAKDHTTIRSDDKHAREEKNSLESRQKRTRLPESYNKKLPLSLFYFIKTNNNKKSLFPPTSIRSEKVKNVTQHKSNDINT